MLDLFRDRKDIFIFSEPNPQSDYNERTVYVTFLLVFGHIRPTNSPTKFVRCTYVTFSVGNIPTVWSKFPRTLATMDLPSYLLATKQNKYIVMHWFDVKTENHKCTFFYSNMCQDFQEKPCEEFFQFRC